MCASAGSRQLRRSRAARRSGAWACCLWLLAAEATAVEWRYTVRPGDSLWTITLTHLKDGLRYWRALAELNGLEHPDRIDPGTELRIPVRWLRTEPTAARLVAVVGVVTIERAGGAVETGAEGLLLRGGDVLRTAEEASVTVRLGDGAEMLVGPGSEIVFDRLTAYGPSGIVDSRIRLEQGRTDARVEPPRGGFGQFEIESPAAVGAVRGTEFRVAHDAAGTRNETLMGRVEVAAGARAVQVPAGFGTVTRPDQPPEPPRRLPAAPAAWIDAALDRVPQRLAMVQVEGAVGYRLEVAADAEFRRMVLSREAIEPAFTFDLPDGAYRVRGRAIDADGIEGLDLDQMIVVAARPEPPVPLRPQRGAIEREARPRFAWAAPDDASAYRFQLARDEGFVDRILDVEVERAELRPEPGLPPGTYVWRLATVVGERRGPFGDPVPFERREPASVGAPEIATAAGGLILRWPRLEPGQILEVELVLGRSFDNPLVAASLREPELTVPDLAPGRYRFRTRVIEADGYATAWSTPQALDVPRPSFWHYLVVPLLLLVPLLL